MHIAIVEDDQEAGGELERFIRQYEKENSCTFQLSVFSGGKEILNHYIPHYDIILLDIMMPDLDGMQVARQIREQDEDVVLVFITNLPQYAIHGYEVGALDFILKPINYYTFSVRFARAIKRAQKREDGRILLKLPESIRPMSTGEIYYVEVQNHMLHYHTQQGEFILRGTMRGAELELERYHFVRCNHWYLVNLRHVTEVKRDVVLVAGKELEISRRNRAAFLTALTDYVGGSG